ncbi:ribosomal protein S5 domain 2-type protein [Chaetomium sp. MPI-CAGE-AT-0009]|nr:ribosomal protein S5 domain 2-type protein [Chaetomium sp. MPI-CAGE-AT-0009]
MPREAEPSLNEKQFVTQALQENLRLDGRQLDQYRPLEISFGDQYGVADVTLGKTRVLAKATAEVTVPYVDRPLDGIFTIATELSPMTSPAFEVNRPTETEVLLSRLLEKTVRRSGALDTESLCLVAGQKCWSVRVDVHVPDTSMEAGRLTVYTPAEREPVPLSWLHSPLCVTWSFFGDDGETAVLDATWLEEQVRVASCTISLNKHGEICQIAKLGGTPVDAVALLQCTSVALSKVKEFSDLLDTRLAEDLKRRDKGGSWRN